jgi:hypothetical protein
MRIYWVVMIGLSVLAISPAFATSEVCRSIAVDKERLACFDRAASPGQNTNPRAASSQSSAVPKFVDPVDALKTENDKVSAHLKGICRGC